MRWTLFRPFPGSQEEDDQDQLHGDDAEHDGRRRILEHRHDTAPGDGLFPIRLIRSDFGFGCSFGFRVPFRLRFYDSLGLGFGFGCGFGFGYDYRLKGTSSLGSNDWVDANDSHNFFRLFVEKIR